MPDDAPGTDDEIAAIFARLKEEVRRHPAPGGDRTRQPSRTLATRSQAERAWAVTAERPFERSPTRRTAVQSYVIVPVKRLLRKLMRWYVEPLAAEQRSFNLAILTLVDELAERIHADVTELERRIDALDERSSGGGPDPRT
jgi:hypothetical protein